MGITSSNSRIDQVLSQKLLVDSWREPLIKPVLELMEKELEALLPPKLGESSGETDRETETEARFCEFMKGGGCKESFRALEDCVEEAGIGSRKCKGHSLMLFKCMYSHPDYYYPILAVMKTVVDHGVKELGALDARKQALRDEALAARKQALKDELRRFS